MVEAEHRELTDRVGRRIGRAEDMRRACVTLLLAEGLTSISTLFRSTTTSSTRHRADNLSAITTKRVEAFLSEHPTVPLRAVKSHPVDPFTTQCSTNASSVC